MRHSTKSWRPASTRKVVSETLGHGSVGITLDVYSHVLPSMSPTDADAIDAVFEGG
jgi:hypothetical protein